MLSALAFGITGILTTYFIATLGLDWTSDQAFFAMLVSFIAGWVSLGSTLYLESKIWVKKWFFRGTKTTWAWFLSSYFGSLMAFDSQLRGYSLLVLALPLIFVTGFTIITFGPVQDARIRRRAQRDQLAPEPVIESSEPHPDHHI